MSKPEMFTRDDMARAVEKEHRRHCRKTHYEAVYGNASSNTKWCDWVNPYAAPPLPPEPPEGTVVVDRAGIAHQRDGSIYKDYPWRSVDGAHASWGHLATQRVPLRVAVPLTDEERTLVARSLNQWAYNTSHKSLYVDLRALADRIEGTQP